MLLNSGTQLAVTGAKTVLRVYLADATSFDGKDQPVYDSVADKGMSHWFYMGDVKHTQIYGALCALQWLTGPIDASTGPPGEPFG